ncbi:MAG TPA: deoxyribonuclease V [Gammaproteobacteria bacterium]|nr:deoxyribonuclease V [Gammaproteobacteria bacterium]
MAGRKWDIDVAEARELQEKLRGQVILEDRLGPVRSVAGLDCAFKESGRLTRAAAVVLDFPNLDLLDYAIAERPTDFPYVPGLLSFREVPALLLALGKLRHAPDLLLCDGQGYAHPRRFGLACHLGVATGLPSIGVAKSRLIGRPREPGYRSGSRAPLKDGDEVIGAVLRTRTGVKPLYVSVGHRVCLETAVGYVLRCCRGYRLPETTRWADGLAADSAFRLPTGRPKRIG